MARAFGWHSVVCIRAVSLANRCPAVTLTRQQFDALVLGLPWQQLGDGGVIVCCSDPQSGKTCMARICRIGHAVSHVLACPSDQLSADELRQLAQQLAAQSGEPDSLAD